MPSIQNSRFSPIFSAFICIIGLGCLLQTSARAQITIDQAREAVARDMSNWVQFPPRHSTTSSASSATTRPQPSPPIVAPGTTVNSQGWLTYSRPDTFDEKQKTQAFPSAQVIEPPASIVPTIKNFEFNGHSVYSSELLISYVLPWVGKPIQLSTLQEAVEKISALYRQDGWLAKVELPSQDLTDGLVKINVIEAMLSVVDVQSSLQAAITPDIPRNFVEYATPLNEPLSLKKLERASQLINELPGVESSLSLRPGSQPGETEAVITLADSKPHEASFMVDNGGSVATGNIRTTAQASLKGIFKRGDLTTVQISKSEGMRSGRLSYSEPIGASGMRGGFYGSLAHYQLTLPSFSELHAHGPSNTLGLELMYPWLRNASHSINWTANLERKRFQNFAESQLASDYRSYVLSTGVNGQFQDFLKGSNSASLLFNLGYLDLSGSLSEAKDALGPRSAGMFNKTRLQWIRQQKLTDLDMLQFNMQSQWASKNLDGSEKIFLGGPQGIRAYPVNEAGASAGHIVNLEWSRQVDWLDEIPLIITAFKDVGYAKVYKYTWSNDDFNKYALRGHGLSLGTSFNSTFGQSQLKLTWAKRLGLNPVAKGDSQATDQDGTLSINRFWLSFSHYF